MIVDLVAFLTFHLGSLAIIAGSAWVFGDASVRAIRWPVGDRPSGPLVAVLGLGLMAQALFLLGLVGGFRRDLILGLLVVAHLLCWRSWRRLFRQRRRAAAVLAERRWWAIGAVVAAAPMVALALYPATGWDPTTYHLPFVREFLDAGRLVFVADLRYPVFPQVAEMGFLVGFLLSGEIAAKLTQTLCLLLTAAVLFDLGRRRLGRRVGVWAAALWLGTPAAVWLGATAYVDVELTLFVTAAIASWERWHAGGDRRWIGLAGAFAGLAAGTKYLGLFFCAFYALATLLERRRRGGAAVWRPLVVFAVLALLFLGPWYVRIVYHTGNPVFPFYTPVFGENEWATRHDQLALGAGRGEEVVGLGPMVARLAGRVANHLGFLLAVPWNAVFHRELFLQMAPLTPFYILLIPLAAPFAAASPPGRRLLAASGLYGLFWLSIEHDLRFLLPALPALNLALAVGLDRLVGTAERKWRRGAPAGRWTAAAVAVTLVVPGPAYAVYKIVEKGPLPVTVDGRSAFLALEVPGFRAVRALDEVAGEAYVAYGLGTSRLRYYAAGRLLGDVWGPAAFARVRPLVADPPALAAELRSLGAGYLLIDRENAGVMLPAEVGAPFRALWDDGRFALFALDQRYPRASRRWRVSSSIASGSAPSGVGASWPQKSSRTSRSSAAVEGSVEARSRSSPGSRSSR